MQFEVIYEERTYGTGANVEKYKIHIEQQKVHYVNKQFEPMLGEEIIL